MNAFLATLDSITQVARVAFLATAVVVAAVCITDWAVRTRRISPFSGIARYTRVWALEDGQWRIVGGHVSMVPSSTDSSAPGDAAG